MTTKSHAPLQSEAIAIIGSGCRFPGNANSPSQLWKLLSDPPQVAESIPRDRFNLEGFYHSNPQYHGHSNVKEAYFLAGIGAVRRFDAAFFGMNSSEANSLDPQCRLLLETVYEALEAAGLPMEALRGSDTAVYTGQMVADYLGVTTRDIDDSAGNYHASGTSRAMLSNRISYFFDWHGPSMTIDTACSSSLVALHEGVQQLRSGRSRIAIAAGANLILDPGCFIFSSSLNMLSPDGRSRMWDAGANGYARGEGIAAVVLKTLSAAIADGDEIECIVRESAFGQDGKTHGITMPNHVAQVQLIRDCYERAGLDLSIPAHRPQFFECHGTGTQAGDATEAEAISSAFFPKSSSNHSAVPKDSPPLLVGSVKTIVGHTEGTAGLAGIIKASLALQNATIPPNLLFERLNPSIEPFYTNLQVTTRATPWPHVLHDGPRRASVNSFGFGGANVHAILESYVPQTKLECLLQGPEPIPVFTPFVFSALSETSLIAYLASFRQYLRMIGDTINLRDLAFTLHSRRTCFQATTAITAFTFDDLCIKLDAKLNPAANSAEAPAVVRTSRKDTLGAKKGLILGIFTGQGAQWAGMGLDLIMASPTAKGIIERLEACLNQLPNSDRPPWSLIQELQKGSSSSRVREAALSQPLCTAVQILQVDLLRAAGISFAAVVGHSSGEIAAAYAAGFISAENAICIAYYRGLHSTLASGLSGRPGAMLAVGTSAEDAQELCADPEFEGRICIAAINSPVSLTLSGDKDAIEKVAIILKDESKFCRLLNVDKAYHSRHMAACSIAYVKSLDALRMETHDGSQSTWFSTVLQGDNMANNQNMLQGVYWDQNMCRPVLFQQAIQNACVSMGPFDMAIEVGPHPALKGPVLQTIQESTQASLLYTSPFIRGSSALESITDCMGYVWSHLGRDAINLQHYDSFVSQKAPCRLVKGLPTYAWDYQGEYWNESRWARAYRNRSGPVHELLGHLTPDSTNQDMRWRHVLRPTEITWLTGHQLQNQIVFPAAGYVVTALEAAMCVCKDKGLSASLIEIVNIDFSKALVFEQDQSSVEVHISLADISNVDENSIYANFKYYAADGKNDGDLNLMAHGRVQISLGEPYNEVLPDRLPKAPNLLKVSVDDFYAASQELEYRWTGPFMALDKLERKLGVSTGIIKNLEPSELLLHPAIIDGAIQSVLLTYSFPRDGQLWTIHVPERIGRVSVNPSLCAREMADGKPLPFDSSHPLNAEAMLGNTSIFPNDSEINNAMIQIQKLECVPLFRVTPQDDKEAFATIVWDLAAPNAQVVTPGTVVAPDSAEIALHLERMAAALLRFLDQNIPKSHHLRNEGPHTNLLQFASGALSSARAAGASHWSLEWEHDTIDPLASACNSFPYTVDMQLLQAVTHDIMAIVDSSDTMTNDGGKQDTMTKLYTEGLGPQLYINYVARVVKQLTHRNPHMEILEIGARTGATTKAIFNEVGSAFGSYTFTDVSTRLSNPAENWTEQHLHKMLFKSLDITETPITQGYEKYSYDVIIASLYLHTTPSLEQSLQNARYLLKPGGYLIVLELLPTTSPVYGLILGLNPTWWIGMDQGRISSPAVSLLEWDALLRKTGFSGCDTTTPEIPEQNCMTHFTTFVSQSIDDKIEFFRSPLSAASGNRSALGLDTRDLVILSGNRLGTIELGEQIKGLVGHNYANIRMARTLLDLSWLELPPKTAVLSLVDIDGSMFQHLQEAQWNTLKDMLMSVEILVWVTQGRRADNPYANMMVGLMRSIIREVPTLSYQILDIEDSRDINAYTITESLLRFQAETLWRLQDNIRTTVEPELVIDKDGQTLIPRLMVNKDMNDRYNSAKRSIIAHFNPQIQSLRIAPSDTISGYSLVQEPRSDTPKGSGITLINVTQSLLGAIRVSEFGYLFIVVGRDRASGDQLVSLSKSHSSIISPWESLSRRIQTPIGLEAKLLTSFTYHILASVILERLLYGDNILVYEPHPDFAAILSKEAVAVGAEITIVTASNFASSGGTSWLKLHPLCSDGEIVEILSKGISVFVDLAEKSTDRSLGDRIRAQLPSHCRLESLQTLFKSHSVTPPISHTAEISKRLHHAATCSAQIEVPDYHMPRVVSVDSLAKLEARLPLASVCEWTGVTLVPVLLKPTDNQMNFSKEGTYWLAGLTGGLGLALCEWMVEHGAKFFVISSRRPNVDPAWLEEMRKKGVFVKISACDITSTAETRSLFSEICATMPPIRGVAQGAMVLEDTPIRDMSLDNLLKATTPKVAGSAHLDDLFQENTLEFFVFFSSVVSVIGRPGQSNYTAANMFMASLAERRRKKGLAASIIHIGAILGVGYITQQGKSVFSKAAMRQSSLIATSQRDFYQLFAEAVIKGKAEMPWSAVELFTGAKRISRHNHDQPIWENEPLMSHFILNPEELVQTQSNGSSSIPLKAQLTQAVSRSQIYDIILDALFPKICSLFQLDTSKVSKDNLTSMRLDEMGIDSLLAVEIRGWFMKNLEVNIPVLKILSGIPIGEVITLATGEIPVRLVPNLEEDQGVMLEKNDSKSVASHELSTSSEMIDTQSDVVSNSDHVPSTASSVASTTGLDHEAAAPSPIVEKSLRLSFSQEMFWFVWKFLKDKTSLNHTAWARITGRVRLLDLQKAIQLMGQRHEALRTCITETADGTPLQTIMQNSTLHLEFQEIDDVGEIPKAVQFLQDHHVFDVARGQTMRTILFSRSSTEHFIVAGIHPLIADGISIQNFFKSVHHLYAHSDQLHGHRIRQFSHYSEKQHADFASKRFTADLQFWKSEFRVLPPPLPILTISQAFSRPPLKVYKNNQAVLKISVGLKRKIQAVCRRYRTTPFHFYLAAFRALLLRYAPVGEAEDLAIGIGDSNRTEDDMMDVIGPLVNLLALRFCTKPSTQFTHLLQHTRDKTYAALNHSKIPFQVLLHELDVSRSMSYPSLFQCFVNYRQGLTTTVPFDDGAAIHAVEIGISKMPYDVTLEMVDYGDGECHQTFVTRDDLYDLAATQRLVGSYECLVNAFVTEPTLALNQPCIFRPAELQKAIQFSRGPYLPSEWPETVVHRIHQICKLKPNDVASRYGKETVTYTQLLAHTTAIAVSLQDTSIAFGSPVAVLQKPESSWVSSFLGVMQAGAIYLPLDLSLPWARLAAIVADSQPPIILVDDETERHVGQLNNPNVRVINVSKLSVGQHVGAITISASAKSPAAMLYTSGSTGTPKGMVLKHENFTNWAEPIMHQFGLGAEVVLQQTSPAFDVSLMQVFTSLCFGGSLLLVSQEQRSDAIAVSKIIRNQNATVVFATPSEYETWFHYGKEELRDSSSWRTAFVTGESVPLSIRKSFSERLDLAVYNLYGPTETALAATFMRLSLTTSDTRPIAAGRPLPNYSVYIQDAQLNLVASGVQGEVYIGGAGVGLGYLNKPELTAAKFLPDAFATAEEKARGWTNMHRTGDLGRWREDGTLVIEGRLSGDTQVKIRGMRIDLAEVEHNIIEVAGGVVRSAAVSSRASTSDQAKFLVAHVVFSYEDSQPYSKNLMQQHINAIQSKLSKILPQCMCPAAFIPLSHMPATSSGKLDRRTINSLPLSNVTFMAGGISATEVAKDSTALTNTEAILREIWLQILPRQIIDLQGQITARTDLFHIGGSSLLLLNLQARIQEDLKIEISLVQMFESSTLGAMARRIEDSQQSVDSNIINWDHETALPATLLDPLSRPISTSITLSEATKVVLTGAMGRLGKGLLQGLIEEPSVKHIHCIGIRNINAAQKYLGSVDKVSLYQGDLMLPRLGLSEIDAAQIFSEVNVVLHNGADVSYLKTYASLRAANVQSTKELAEMCFRHGNRPRPIFHYVSTVSVGNVLTVSEIDAGIGRSNEANDSDNFVLRPVSIAAHPPPTAVSSSNISHTGHGYVSSKWASEVFLERLNARHPDWSVIIHRPSLISGEDWDVGKFKSPGLQLVENLRRYGTLMRAVPVIESERQMRGAFDVVSQTSVVQGILTSLTLNARRLSQERGGAEIRNGDRESIETDLEAQQRQVQILHHIGGEQLPLGDLRSWIRDQEHDKGEPNNTHADGSLQRNDTIKELVIVDWISEAEKLGMHPIMVAMLKDFASRDGLVSLPRIES